MPLCKTGPCPGIPAFCQTKVDEKIVGDRGLGRGRFFAYRIAGKRDCRISFDRHNPMTDGKKACTGQALSRPAVYRLFNAGFNFSIDQIFPGQPEDTPPGS